METALEPLGLFFSGIQYCQFLIGFVYERSQTKPNAHLTDAAESESKPKRLSPTFVRTLPLQKIIHRVKTLTLWQV